ncbi:MAG: DUF3110 domain-containing protein [Desulfarculaceae bacterium]|jgi:hypothetical protein
MEEQTASENHVWIIIEKRDENETILGLTNNSEENFIPVTANKEDGLLLSGRLPQEQGAQRQVEAIHKDQIIKEAQSNGFAVYLVDGQGNIGPRLSDGKEH